MNVIVSHLVGETGRQTLILDGMMVRSWISEGSRRED